jgi:hypothetical protein
MTHDSRTAAEALLAAVEKMTPGPWKAGDRSSGYVFYGLPIAGGEIRILRIHDTTRPYSNAVGVVALRNDAPAIIRALLAECDRMRGERDAARALALDAVGHLQHTLACTGDRAWNLDLCDCYVRRFEERLAALTGAKP